MKYHFVKFVPYNENTLSALITKTIKFSTVYEFNDFNELRYVGSRNFTGIGAQKKSFENTIKDKFDVEYKCNLLKKIYESGEYCQKYLESFKKRLNNYIENTEAFEETDYQLIAENMAFSSVGIFCISSLEVFKNDAAQIMFAHYGQNLKGLALIYEISKECLIIDYANPGQLNQGSGGDQNRFYEWVNGAFKADNMDDFLKKSENWKYEKEYRLFSTPNVRNSSKHGVVLKAIFHTPRFGENLIKTLEKLNKGFYEDKLLIKRIYPSKSHYRCEAWSAKREPSSPR